MLMNGILQWMRSERHTLVHLILDGFTFLPFFRCKVKEVLIRILLVVELGKETAAVLQLNVASLFDLAVQVGLNLAAAPLAHISWH